MRCVCGGEEGERERDLSQELQLLLCLPSLSGEQLTVDDSSQGLYTRLVH